MSKIVVLAEKPSVGRDIARVLNCNKKGNGFIEGDKYIVTWALGHLVTLADPECYGDKYKTWNIEDLPIIPGQMKTDVIQQSSRQYNAVKTQLLRKDVSEIIIATDAGREGELVARWIIEKAKVKKPMKRLWISSVTDKAIKEGFSKLRPAKEFENLYASAVARSEADWVVGINATRALTCKHNAQLSCGRVQTPTVAMIAQKEEEIRKFKSKEFYGITAIAGNIKLTWQDKQTKDIKTFNQDYCDGLVKSLGSKQAKVIDVEKSLKKTYAPRLYDLTELQRDANKMFNFSAKDTLSIMQTLYERHKVLTYPRTDARYISTDIIETLGERVRACQIGPYAKLASKILRAPIKGNNRFVDNAKVSDHHAIIPTEESPDFRSFNDRERKIYDLVVKRFLSVLYPAFEYEQTTIKADIGGEIFVARGKRVIAQGWKEVYENKYADDEETIEEQSLPVVTKGDVLTVSHITKTTGKTSPPAPFNEATLLSAMENPTKYMDSQDKELIKTIGETGGLGTVATRADIIEKLFNSFLLEKRGKDIWVTSKGKQLLELVPEGLKSPTLTGEWEQKLSAIAKGTLKKDVFVREMENYAREAVKEIKDSTDKFKHDNMTTTRCPDCNKFMLSVNGKRGKMLVCQDRECGSRKMISKTTNSRCPNCRKKLELRGEGEGQIFVCVCGHREKLSSFNQRKQKEGNRLSKTEVSKYMGNQKKKEEGFGSAFDDAFSNLKF
ncbi:MAG TPA: DNA topoisomerase III [Epulopiscium sp.]|nr:DNA topoisomerase III [Candidatus Epulonipiscium sp.]